MSRYDIERIGEFYGATEGNANISTLHFLSSLNKNQMMLKSSKTVTTCIQYHLCPFQSILTIPLEPLDLPQELPQHCTLSR